MRLIVLVFALVAFVAACGDRTPAPVMPSALTSAELVPVFVATNRTRNEEGYLNRGRSDGLHFLKAQVSVPPVHQAGDAPRYSKTPNPNKHFVLASQSEASNKSAFVAELRKALNKRRPENREITVFVHGYYNSYSDSVFRMAQMHSDFELKGVPVAFSWPSAGKATGYTYDRDSVLYSRDDLEELLYILSEAGARNILIAAHSMGGLLTMETMRQIERKRPGWSKRNIGSVVLMSPDISVDVFRGQAKSIKAFPEPFVVVSSQKDKVLKLSRRLNLNEERLGLGNSVSELSEFPITFIDVTNLSDSDINPHFVAAESPALISIMTYARELPGYTHADQSTILGSFATDLTHLENSVEITLAPENGR